MKTLPKHICAHPEGLLVRIRRGDVTYQAFVNKSRSNALAEAIAIRERFLQIAGRPKRKARSNTGVLGVSEITHWKRSRPYDVFSVSWSAGGRVYHRRVSYGLKRSRESALREAVALRVRMTGEPNPMEAHNE
jgi:hypothetical protein